MRDNYYFHKELVPEKQEGWLLLPNFWLTYLIKFLKNPKIAKNKENPKKYVFNIFASFLAFSASSQKNLIFQRSFERVRLFKRHFLKSLIFLIKSTLILLVFKKIQEKTRKIKIYKKRKLRNQFWGMSNILPINIGPQLKTRGVILNIWGGNTRNPKPISNQTAVFPIGQNKRAAAPPLV